MAVLRDADAWGQVATRTASVARSVATDAVGAEAARTFVGGITALAFLGLAFTRTVAAELAVAHVVFLVGDRCA